MGPTSYYLISFEGNRFGNEIMPELIELADRNLIRILDLLMLQRDDGGDVLCFEVSELPDLATHYDVLEPGLGQWFSQDDVEQVAETMPPETTAALVLVEHVWARTLGEAVARARGRFLLHTQVPRELMDDVEAKLGAASHTSLRRAA